MEIGWRMINHPLQDAERDTIVVQFDAVDDQDDLTLDGSDGPHQHDDDTLHNFRVLAKGQQRSRLVYRVGQQMRQTAQ
jgi:hypothetical protein